jgi:Retroviral aspartyl protease.
MKLDMRIVALALVFVLPASAETQCPPLKIVASLDLVSTASANRHLIPMEISGTPRRMILDLGASVSMLSAKAASELGISTRKSRNVKIYSLTGASSDRYASVPVKLGTMPGNVDMFVSETLNDLSPDPLVAGLLGTDVLSNYDLSIDFGANKLELLSQDHCEGNVVYWPATAAAVVPFQIWSTGKIIFDVSLDGKTMKATLDTGAPNSTLRLDTAEREFGLQPGATDTPETGHLNEREDLKTYRHTFKTLDFHGVAVGNPSITLVPEKMSKILAAGESERWRDPVTEYGIQAPILIGMNVLKHLHIYIAYGEKKLYITPAGTPKEASAPK